MRLFTTGILSFILLGSSPVLGQKIERQQLQDNLFDHYTAVQYRGTLSVNSPKNSAEVLAMVNMNFDGAWDSLRVIEQIESPVGVHYVIRRYLHEHPIYGCDIKLNLDHNGDMRSAYLVPLPEHADKSTDPKPLAGLDWLQRRGEMLSSESELVYFPNLDMLVPAVAHRVLYDDHRYEEWVFGADDAPLYWRDLNLYQDTTLDVLVFNPDPLTTAGVAYGAPYLDMSDSDVSVLNNQRQNATVKGTFINNTFYLENDHAKISDFDAPAVSPATSSTPTFHFSRAENGFEDVNALYHITETKEHLLDLGFNTLVNYQIEVDAHAFNGQDNSMFSSATFPPRLFFGDGGVDDAEDADVVVHEYGHGISHSAAPGTFFGVERLTLEEANADYLAVSYSMALNPNDAWHVFTWDGHNEYWPGRNAYTSKNYTNINFGTVVNIYEHTDLWVAALMAGRGQLGRDAMDKLVISALYAQAAHMTFPQMAWEILLADSANFGGVHVPGLYANFVQYGILPEDAIALPEPEEGQLQQVEMRGSRDFASGGTLFLGNPEHQLLQIKLYTVGGQVLWEGETDLEEWSLSGSFLPSGMYLLDVRSGNNRRAYKLIRY